MKGRKESLDRLRSVGQSSSKKKGFFARVRELAGRIFARDDDESDTVERRGKIARRRDVERVVTAPPTEEPAVTETPVAPRAGAARDERSFEQRRRGGPMTGGSPEPKAHGPRHTGGAKKRGRASDAEALEGEAIAQPPFDDYDELSVDEIQVRIIALDETDLASCRDYEVANKHRKNVIDAIEKRLGGRRVA